MVSETIRWPDGRCPHVPRPPPRRDLRDGASRPSSALPRHFGDGGTFLGQPRRGPESPTPTPYDSRALKRPANHLRSGFGPIPPLRVNRLARAAADHHLKRSSPAFPPKCELVPADPVLDPTFGSSVKGYETLPVSCPPRLASSDASGFRKSPRTPAGGRRGPLGWENARPLAYDSAHGARAGDITVGRSAQPDAAASAGHAWTKGHRLHPAARAGLAARGPCITAGSMYAH